MKRREKTTHRPHNVENVKVAAPIKIKASELPEEIRAALGEAISNSEEDLIKRELVNCEDDLIKSIEGKAGCKMSELPFGLANVMFMKANTDNQTRDENYFKMSAEPIANGVPATTMMTGNPDFRFAPLGVFSTNIVYRMLNDLRSEDYLEKMFSAKVDENIKHKLAWSINNILNTGLDSACSIMVLNEFYATVEQCLNLLRDSYDIVITMEEILDYIETNNVSLYFSRRVINTFNYDLVDSRISLNDLNDESFFAYMEIITKLFARDVTLSFYELYANSLRSLIYRTDNKNGLVDLSTLYNFCLTFTGELFNNMEEAIYVNMLTLVQIKSDVESDDGHKIVQGIVDLKRKNNRYCD